MKQSMRIRHPGILAGVATLLASTGAVVQAADTATQDVDVTVAAVNEISVGAAVVLNINTATAGSTPSGNASSTYAITTNSATSKKITAQLTAPLTSGLSLSVNLQAPSTGTSAGLTVLSTSASDVVTSIEAVAASGLTIGYTATATVAVAPNTYSADVTYTVVSDS